jgi:hypothetical protein
MFVYGQNPSYLYSTQVTAFVFTMYEYGINTTMTKFIYLYENIMTHEPTAFLVDDVQYVYI